MPSSLVLKRPGRWCALVLGATVVGACATGDERSSGLPNVADAGGMARIDARAMPGIDGSVPVVVSDDARQPEPTGVDAAVVNGSDAGGAPAPDSGGTPGPVANCPNPPSGAAAAGVVQTADASGGKTGDKIYTVFLDGTTLGIPKLQCGIDVRVFAPAGALAGALIKPSSTSVSATGYAEEAMRTLRFGVVALRLRLEDGENMTSRPSALGKALVMGLQRIAAASQRPDIEHLPWVLTGQSRGGAWSRDLAFLYPNRTIAYGNVSGWVGKPTEPEKRSIPALFVLGNETDAAEPWKMLDGVVTDYFPGRTEGNPWGVAFQWGQNEHSSAEENNIVLPFFQAIAALRLPAAPAAGAPALAPVSAETGWFGKRTDWMIAGSPASLLEVTGAEASYPTITDATQTADKPGSVWLPDRRTAYIWRAFMVRDPKITLAATAGSSSLPAKGRRMVVDVGAEVTLTTTGTVPSGATVRYFDGDMELGSATAAPFTVKWKPSKAGIGAVYAQVEAGATKTTTRPALIVARAR